jgi:phage shock protein B
MQVFEFVIAILLIVLGFKLIQTRMSQSHERNKLSTEDERDLKQALHRLEERVRVLERIVTDHRADLKRQLSDLED